jgi:hypothetical protein
MRRLITLHIGRGLEAYPMVPQWTAITRLLFGLLGAMGIDLPAGRTDFQRWGLHPEDARGRVIQLLQAAATQGRWQASIATNDASTINALVEALTEGELRVVSHAADGTVRQWDVDQMMAFWAAREQGSEMTPAAMLIKLGVWP